ncbi:DUF4411 family protein [Oenococcus kitaharae]|uniref:DUF4411 family protein n=1 Tax=Oenococcus TaxID=46254 RepID=UPI0021E854CC|nr:DUF4411 family protein [Oenococcus kitaharae]MCV3297216.1 DUF4411 family protein [Oenococcus kitaharae]
MTKKYILDSNIYIDFYDRYYAVGYFPSFWSEVPNFLNDQVVIPKVVLDEHYQDPWFRNWITNNYKNQLIDERLYTNEWQQILGYLTQSPLYKDVAVTDPKQGWANSFIADGWIIAIALRNEYTIVTDELRDPKLRTTQTGTKNAKIPDICDHFGVNCINRNDFFNAIGLKV